jgi:hypothetical protein
MNTDKSQINQSLIHGVSDSTFIAVIDDTRYVVTINHLEFYFSKFSLTEALCCLLSKDQIDLFVRKETEREFMVTKNRLKKFKDFHGNLYSYYR